MASFLPEHPGGEGLLRASLGCDASKNFNGMVYKHSSAARNLMANFRVARLGLGSSDHRCPDRDPCGELEDRKCATASSASACLHNKPHPNTSSIESAVALAGTSRST